MIFVNRDEAAPASLLAQATLQQATDAEEYYKTWKPGDPAFATFTRYKEHDVQLALKRIFKRKCAYCEKQVEKGFFEVEHYRPKGRVEGSDHPGYWWLALAWSNLLPTCPGCNKGLRQHLVTASMTVAEVEALQATPPKICFGKAMQFPVGAARLQPKSDDHIAELPRILDPTRSDPVPELRWRHDAAYSVLEPAEKAGAPSPEGEATIHCLALNRVDLVESRTQVLNRLRAQRIRIMTDLEADAEDPVLGGACLALALRRINDMQLACAPNQPFAGMARDFVATFRAELEQWAQGQGLI